MKRAPGFPARGQLRVPQTPYMHAAGGMTHWNLLYNAQGAHILSIRTRKHVFAIAAVVAVAISSGTTVSAFATTGASLPQSGFDIRSDDDGFSVLEGGQYLS